MFLHCLKSLGQPKGFFILKGKIIMENWKRKFITMYAGQAFSIVGSAIVQFAIIWQLTITTESAMVLSIAMICAFLPTAFLGPFAGVIADRFNRKKVMIIADCFVAVTSVFLGAGFVFGFASTRFIYFFLLLRGVGNALHSPAMQATIPMLVPAEELEKVGGWGMLIQSGASMLGPVMGAMLMNTLPIYVIMIIDIAGAILASVALLFVHVPNVTKSQSGASVIADLKTGFNELINNKPLLALSIPSLFMIIAYMPMAALLPLFIRTNFGGGAFHEGIVEFIYALGMMLGAIVIGIKSRGENPFATMSIAIIGIGLTAGIGGLLTPEFYIVFAVLAFFMGFSDSFFNVPFMAYIQRTVSEENMGKVISIIMTVMSISMPIGLIISGPITEKIGVDNWFAICGMIIIVIGIYLYFSTRKFAVKHEQSSKEISEESMGE